MGPGDIGPNNGPNTNISSNPTVNVQSGGSSPLEPRPEDIFASGVDASLPYTPDSSAQLQRCAHLFVANDGTISEKLDDPEDANMCVPVVPDVPIVTFDQNNEHHLCVAQLFSNWLIQIDFDGANRTIHSDTYGVKPIFDTELNSSFIRYEFRDHPELSIEQKLAILFFTYGDSITSDGVKFLFRNNLNLFNKLLEMGIIVESESLYRLNDLSLTSHQLPNGEVMYLFTDIPERLQPYDEKRTPTAQLSTTSYILLHRLEKAYGDGKKYEGIAADFGSGTGIQAIALLKMYPGLERVFALEIDPHSMNLNRFNAMMSGVSDRCQVVDNEDTDRLSTILEEEGRKLDLAVSNPPFNPVPHKYRDEFTDFGDGGRLGLDITQIFLSQAIPVLKDGGEFIFYSQLAANENGTYFLTNFLEEKCVEDEVWYCDEEYKGIKVTYEQLDFSDFSLNRLSYAIALAKHIGKQRAKHIERQRHKHGTEIKPIKRPKLDRFGNLVYEVDKNLVDEIDKSFSDCGLDHSDCGLEYLQPVVTHIVKVGGSDEVTFKSRSVSLPELEKHFNPKPLTKPGGVFIRIEEWPNFQGGVFEEVKKMD